MSRDGRMSDSFYTPILYQTESKILEGDRLATSQGIRLTDSNIRSLLVKALNAGQGKPPAPLPENAGPKDKFLADFLPQFLEVKNSIVVTEDFQDGTTQEKALPFSDWKAVLETIKKSCQIRTTSEPGSRGYLDFLAEFMAQTDAMDFKNPS